MKARGLRDASKRGPVVRAAIAAAAPIQSGKKPAGAAAASAGSAVVPPGRSDGRGLGAPGDLAAPRSYGPPLPECDERSALNLATLHPMAEEAARWWLSRCRRAGIPVVIICGTRTWAEQAALYAQGRTKPGPVVTQVGPGGSMHNYGMAWDFVVFEGLSIKGGVGQPLWESPLMAAAGGIALELGLDWGGAWKRFKDAPHIQLAGLKVSELRRQWPKGWSHGKA